MENLFDYATKELSQDAFLRWLFESWKDEEVKPVVKCLLKEFCNLDEEIKEIKTIAQEKYIDIKVEIKTISQRKMSLFIEDKTFSNEHKQLTEYDKYIDSLSEEVHKIFYKTNKISDDDKNGVDAANKTNGPVKWKMYNIEQIVELFEKHAPYQNLILQHYIEHIRGAQKNIKNTEKPLSNDKNEDLIRWEGYFYNTIIPKLQGNGYKCSAWKAGQYPYVCLVLTKEGYNTRNVPYLEIRSRDCLNNGFIARVLCYGVSVQDLEKNQKQLELNVKNAGFNQKRIVRRKKGKEIFPKQIGHTDNLVASTDEEFIKLTKEWGEKYLAAMKDWQ